LLKRLQHLKLSCQERYLRLLVMQVHAAGVTPLEPGGKAEVIRTLDGSRRSHDPSP
jgi:hypothetical protein